MPWAALALPAYLRSAVKTAQCLVLLTHPIVCRNMQTCISPGSTPPSFSLGNGSVTLRTVCHIAPYVPFTLPAQISARWDPTWQPLLLTSQALPVCDVGEHTGQCAALSELSAGRLLGGKMLSSSPQFNINCKVSKRSGRKTQKSPAASRSEADDVTH